MSDQHMMYSGKDRGGESREFMGDKKSEAQAKLMQCTRLDVFSKMDYLIKELLQVTDLQGHHGHFIWRCKI